LEEKIGVSFKLYIPQLNNFATVIFILYCQPIG